MTEREYKAISIDIGCGPKNNLPLYDREAGSPTIVLDINRRFLQERRDGRSGNLIQADTHNLPIKDRIANKVFLIHVLEHVDSAEQTLQEIKRITKLVNQAYKATVQSFTYEIGNIDHSQAEEIRNAMTNTRVMINNNLYKSNTTN